MTETIAGHLYDYPRYYDLVFGSDWKAEFDFLKACFQKHCRRTVRRVFEPACGTGRLLVKFAEGGLEVSGNDLNPHAVEFCNRRLERKGFARSVRLGDMSAFRLPRQVDAAFNMINSFRHLQTEEAAQAHLRCTAEALHKDGLYVLGLHLTPTRGPRSEEERWSARRGHLAVLSRLWTMNLDRKQREELVGMTFDVHTPTRHFQLAEQLVFRTYTLKQFRELLARVPQLELVETYDFGYKINQPIHVNSYSEDVVFVLRRT